MKTELGIRKEFRDRTQLKRHLEDVRKANKNNSEIFYAIENAIENIKESEPSLNFDGVQDVVNDAIKRFDEINARLTLSLSAYHGYLSYPTEDTFYKRNGESGSEAVVDIVDSVKALRKVRDKLYYQLRGIQKYITSIDNSRYMKNTITAEDIKRYAEGEEKNLSTISNICDDTYKIYPFEINDADEEFAEFVNLDLTDEVESQKALDDIYKKAEEEMVNYFPLKLFNEYEKEVEEYKEIANELIENLDDYIVTPQKTNNSADGEKKIDLNQEIISKLMKRISATNGEIKKIISKHVQDINNDGNKIILKQGQNINDATGWEEDRSKLDLLKIRQEKNLNCLGECCKAIKKNNISNIPNEIYDSYFKQDGLQELNVIGNKSYPQQDYNTSNLNKRPVYKMDKRGEERSYTYAPTINTINTI